MVDKRNDTDLPEDDNLSDDQEQNLASSGTGRDISKSQMRNMRTTERERRDDEKRAEIADNLRYEGPSLSFLTNYPKPYEKDFTLDKYRCDAKYQQYREMDEVDQSEAKAGRGLNLRKIAAAGAGATIVLAARGKLEIGERQKEFHSVMNDVEAKTGVPKRLIGAFWGNESGFGKNLVSPTNCLGDGQFTRGTWAATIRQYGDRIPGMEQYAADLRSGKIGPNDRGLQEKRLDTKASAYAMGFYISEVARDLKVDAKDEKSWHLIYAGYTVGPGNAKKLDNNRDNDVNATQMLGSVAVNNPMFYNKGRATPAQALSNYNKVIMLRAGEFDKLVVAKLENPAPAANDPVYSAPIADVPAANDPDINAVVAKDAPKAPEPISVASKVDGAVITSSVKPKEGFGDKPKEESVKEAANEAHIDANVTAYDKFKTRLYGYIEASKEPALKPDDKPKVPLHNLVYG